jgi:hypothetical protein
MRRSTGLAIFAAALAVSGLAMSTADARPRGRTIDTAYDSAPPLTVNRRSFLDPGPVSPVGQGPNYVTANTVFNRTPDQTFSPSKFGNETLPRPLEVPGREASFFEFETPAVY